MPLRRFIVPGSLSDLTRCTVNRPGHVREDRVTPGTSTIIDDRRLDIRHFGMLYVTRGEHVILKPHVLTATSETTRVNKCADSVCRSHIMNELREMFRFTHLSRSFSRPERKDTFMKGSGANSEPTQVRASNTRNGVNLSVQDSREYLLRTTNRG